MTEDDLASIRRTYPPPGVNRRFDFADVARCVLDDVNLLVEEVYRLRSLLGITSRPCVFCGRMIDIGKGISRKDKALCSPACKTSLSRLRRAREEKS